MTLYEGLAIASGLAIGYWLVSIFTRPPGADAPERPGQPAAPRDPRAEQADPPWHEVLGVAESATDEEIAAAYRDRIGQYHPDKVATMGPEIRALAVAKSRQLNDAYRQARRR